MAAVVFNLMLVGDIKETNHESWADITAEGGTRTHTPKGKRILSPPRLPFRHLGKKGGERI